MEGLCDELTATYDGWMDEEEVPEKLEEEGTCYWNENSEDERSTPVEVGNPREVTEDFGTEATDHSD